MKIKVCIKCKKEKPLSEFNKAKHHKDGLTSWCKECLKITQQKWLFNNKNKQKTRVRKYRKNHRWLSSYSCAKQRCTNPNNHAYKDYGGRGIEFLISSNDVKELWFRDKAYLLDRPSIERIDNDGHYTFDNCKFIELSINSAKNKRLVNKIVLQFDLEGNFIKEWESATKASKHMNVKLSTLTGCCRGEQKTSAGFIWRYQDV